MSETYEMVDHPNHYNSYDVEVIEMIDKIWGHFLAAKWCEITAFKYRMRMGMKPDNPIEQDIEKERVYLKWYRHYMSLANIESSKEFETLTKEEKFHIKQMIAPTGKDTCLN